MVFPAKQDLSVGKFPSDDWIKKNIIQLSKNPSNMGWLAGIFLHFERQNLYVQFIHSYFSKWFQIYKKNDFEILVKSIWNNVKIIYADEKSCYLKLPGNGSTELDIALKNIEQPSNDFFSDLIVSDKNRLAITAAKNFCFLNSNTSFKTLLFTGVSGSGKSHLLTTIYRTLQYHQIPVIFPKASELITSLEKSRKFNKILDNNYHIIIDNFQDIFGDDSSQNLLIMLLERTASQVQRLVCAMTGNANQLKWLDVRLRQIFESGLIVEIYPPDFDVRLRWLENENCKRHLKLTKEQLIFLARLDAGIPVLKGILIKIEFFVKIFSRVPSLEDIEEFAKEGGYATSHGWREVLQLVSEHLNLSIDEIMGPSRKPRLVLGRQVAMYICRQKLGFSYPELGKIFGGKDHSTVMHAIRKIENMAITNRDVRKLLTELEISLEKGT